MGGAAGEAYANTLKSPGMHPEHVLAREAIQNSVDAEIEGEKVFVRFRQRSLTGRLKDDFVEHARLGDIEARAKQLELSGPNCLATLLKPRTPLSLLYVEDFNAVGLGGDPHDKSSNFYRLLLSLGDRSKNRTSKGTGGSYGFGKSVYSSSSAIQTIFAYTRFRDREGRDRTRIFGCGYYASHEWKGRSFSGRAWLGGRAGAQDGRLIVDPLEDKPADKLAESLGFQHRDDRDYGTSILIVDADVDVQAVVKGVEDWWWPRLIEHRLDVELIDKDSNLHQPRPRKDERLRPFIEAFDIARGRAEPKPGTQKFHRLNNLADTALGSAGFVVVPIDDTGSPLLPPERCNTVALIRSPLMVVAYKPFSETAPLVVGAFVSADEVDIHLKRSEPPAHDRWDPESTNLRDESGKAKEIVKSVLSRIKTGLKRFQTEAAPPTPPKQRRLSLLERALASYFRPTTIGRPISPEPTTSMLHLDFTRQPHAIATDDGRLVLRSGFSVTLDPKAEEDTVTLTLRIGCPVVEDDGQDGDDLPLVVSVKGTNAKAHPDDPHQFTFDLSKNSKAHFAVESAPYNAAWTVRLRPEIEAETAQ
jgi:hypothetical protein